MVKVLNSRKSVAVEPFAPISSTPQVTGGFALASADKSTLVPLKVAFDSEYECLEEKGTVYVLASEASHAFAKEVYQLGSKKFILLPVDRVVLYESPSKDN
jgi:hypothetical protein